MSRPLPRNRTVILFGAPRRDGATGELLRRFCETTNDALTVIDSFERNVRPCDDCRGCYTHDGCVKQDMDDIYDAIEQADKLVFLTPVYNRSFPAPLKAVIDRLQCYWAARFIRSVRPPIQKPKTVTLITVCGSDRNDGECLLYQLKPQLTVLNVTAITTLHIKGSDSGVDWDAVERQLTAL